MDILKKIVVTKKSLLESELAEFAGYKTDLPRRSFLTSLKAKKPAVIAEVKYASPSKGSFEVKHTPEELACLYELGGASALSVLACRPFFDGSPAYVAAAKKATSLPVLWKDFIFDIRQIELAVRCGADAILLICAVLGKELPIFIKTAARAGLEAVVEVYSAEEVQLAKESNAQIILINNRNLRTMNVDINHSVRIAKYFSEDTLVISASGIKTHEDIKTLQEQGINAFLVGESVSRAEKPELAVKALLEGKQV